MVDELAAIWAADLERHALDCRPAVGRRSIPGDCPVHVALDLPGRSGLTHAGYKWDRLKEYRGKANLTLQHRAKGLDLQGGQLQPFMTNTAITRRKSCGICSLIPEDCAGWEDEVLLDGAWRGAPRLRFVQELLLILRSGSRLFRHPSQRTVDRSARRADKRASDRAPTYR